ncbi:MAG: EAL domain-containing protein [Myxococcales bacterium]|nr:EAL domain-containing protein [Myxococcales bacterium]MDP3499021.1 EAL domain-containing protein [Myxococcales bacterium]
MTERSKTPELAQREAELSAAEQALARRAEAAALREASLARQEAMLSARVDERLKSEALLREANERLVVAAVNAQSLTEVAEQARAQMSFMAEHDFLTGLPSRALLNDRLSQALGLAARHRHRVAVMYVDLDHFKHINDSLGHAVGDQLLQSVAQRLLACVRVTDTVSRQGGDEFVVLLSEVKTAHDAAATAEKLLRAMAEPHLIAGNRFHVTLSIGISVFPDDGPDAQSLLMCADTALYAAKREGRNTWRAFTADMNVQAVARQSVEQALHRALERDEFVLHYQPKFNLRTGDITGAEALVRMTTEQGLIPPLQFVQTAEDCGLILPLGKWVMREACRQMVAWRSKGAAIEQIGVNVSALEFHGKDFMSNVRGILTETGLDPRRLELELTESGLIQDTATTTQTLQSLKALGVHIAVDDFGTGYSSLSYLRRFPIDTLKIDQSFVQEIDGDAGNAIVSAVIAMGVSLNHRVVAEGIETIPQLAFLRAHACEEGQGYLFSPPVTAEVLGKMLPRAA